MIEKNIHYCWFGNGEKNGTIKKCIDSWANLLGYKVIEWNEKNCSLNENEYVRNAVKQRKWAFLSDYYRLKALYQYGGIYLDTDVEVKKSFPDKILTNKLFLGFEYDCVISTAVIGAEKNNKIIKELMEEYDKINLDGTNNNTIFNNYLLAKYSEFRLNNKKQILGNGDITIYPKEYFTCPTRNKKYGYSIHHFEGSWIKEDKSEKILKPIIKHVLGNYLYLNIARKRALKKSKFYKIYLEHKKLEE